ncbi:LOW QUALITY PROTEIN: SAM-dependent methyltransferase [Psychrobacter sp. JCM 18902]|nr:LOW QUALITY PROTEIN: SAM-dependent methyltransferase [Psychrobacter sp. JCM 18902]
MVKDNLGNIVSNLPFSQACENNQQPILDVLQQELQDATHVLEVGSGTGQHSIYFAPRLTHLHWQTSDVYANHAIINAWHVAYPAPNLYAPLSFDVSSDSIPINKTINAPYDAVFTANTLHIMSWSLVSKLFELVGDILPLKGKFIVYGFNENGSYSSASNRQFDHSLRQRDANSGIRHLEDVIDLANTHHLTLNTRYEMPSNNQILVFEKLY